ncbi:uncharacterized protein EV420DRAFT_1767770 [Desarmillaria tabescens]|uniref:Uncharacterized protein n=1 Tax=Armillaria tabescens TaxID=1929756 RepID=A0AA39JRZ0_ARMTA|nr:uncharacterized protein EV420DRAFT_1767770 [Desarmillaria tabescens]KAK0446379.1 hypothetical protein EV420DRAFT_1767770 [Desarmillaria tabescens]
MHASPATTPPPLTSTPKSKKALSTHKPVVALETILVTHGFPHLINYTLSSDLEDIVRSMGYVPATIGIVGGRIKVGLERAHIPPALPPPHRACHHSRHPHPLLGLPRALAPPCSDAPVPPACLLQCILRLRPPMARLRHLRIGHHTHMHGPAVHCPGGPLEFGGGPEAGAAGEEVSRGGEIYQFGLLIASAGTYVASAWWIVNAYPAAASSPLSSTFLGVEITALLFLTFIGFFLRRTNIIESSGLALFMAYNVWLCGFDQELSSDPSYSYVPLLPNLIPHLQTLLNFVTNTLPKPVLVALLYRLTVLQLASKILPGIGADSWDDEDGVDNGWEDRPTLTLTRILLTYRQLIFVTVYSHLLLLDHSSQVWWRWINIFFTLVMWSIELLVSTEDDTVQKEWKVD